MLLLWQWRGKSGRNCFNFVRGNPNGRQGKAKISFSVEASQFRRDMRFWTIFWSKVLQIVAPSLDKVSRPLHLIKISIQYKLMMWTPYWQGQDVKMRIWNVAEKYVLYESEFGGGGGCQKPCDLPTFLSPTLTLPERITKLKLKLKFQLKSYKSQR